MTILWAFTIITVVLIITGGILIGDERTRRHERWQIERKNEQELLRSTAPPVHSTKAEIVPFQATTKW